ncbi:MAG: [acyl-carrier-protein] S-malonyltransferase [Gammaproteobacteria bacterium]|nr:MAG: [acyl-carrier-protein] S-malonyltransferase [Gammaproteobacteria bacterium]
MSQGVAFVFPGQGSQSVGMLEHYFSKEKKFNYVFDKSKDVLGVDFKDLVLNGSSEDLSPTEITQPLMLTANNAIWECLEIEAQNVTIMAGHSLGEFSAFVAGEALTFEEGLRLVSSRAKFMQEAVPEGEGAIAAIIGLTYEDLNSICLSISNEDSLVELANINSSNQIVISGTKEAVDLAIQSCSEAGAKRALLLPMSVPAHCDLMKPASEKFKEVLNSINMQAPKCDIIQNVDASITSSVEKISENLISQIYKPVRWTDIMNSFNKLALGKCIECGPGKVLSGLMKRTLKDTRIISLDDYESFLDKESLI